MEVITTRRKERRRVEKTERVTRRVERRREGEHPPLSEFVGESRWRFQQNYAMTTY